MNERNVSERIVRAVDTRLSGLTGDPWMARRVLARSKAAPVRRKKRAAALIVAAVLALAGVGALAASLLWRDQAAPMKQIGRLRGLGHRGQGGAGAGAGGFGAPCEKRGDGSPL